MSASPELIETTVCPNCSQTAYTVIRPACYPDAITQDELLKLYSSSSDHALMDQLVKCASCSLLYLNPRIKASIIMDSYSSAVDPVFFEQNSMRIKTFDRCFRKILRMYSIVPERSKQILDIGCAGGAFLKAATDMGFSGVGIEPSSWLCDQGKVRYGLDLRPGDLSTHSFPPASFFMVTLWDVLEHLTMPGETLDQSHKLLKNDGYLILNLPNYNSLVSRILGSHWPFLLSVHLTYFTPETLGLLLKRHGFTLMSVTPYFQTLELGYILKRAAAIWPPFGLLKSITNLLGIDHWPFSYNMGQMTVVARKA